MATTTQRYMLVVKGELKFGLPGRVEADGTVRILNGSRWMPVVLGSECEERGLDKRKVLDAATPAECLARLGMNRGNVEILTSEEWDERQRQAWRRQDDAREAAIPGLRALTALADRVEDDRDRHDRQFVAMMEDEDNDGVNPPKPTDETAADRLRRMKAEYPRATLYLEAKRQSESSHWSDPTGAAGAGKRAMEILEAGGTTEDAATALAYRRPIDPGL